MKNQAELGVKKPPTARLKTQVNIFNKKDVPSTSVQSKGKFSHGTHNNQSYLKKKSAFSPRNNYLGKPYANGSLDKTKQTRREQTPSNNETKTANNDHSPQISLMKSKSSSQYQLNIAKPFSPNDSDIFGLKTQKLKQMVVSYQKQIHELQTKIIRLENQIKQKENRRLQSDIRANDEKKIQISGLRQQLISARHREELLNNQKKQLLQNQLYYKRKLQQLQIQIFRDKNNYQKSLENTLQEVKRQKNDMQKSKATNLQEFRMIQRRLIDRHTEIIRGKQKQIQVLKACDFQHKEKIKELQHQIQKLKYTLSDRPARLLTDIQKQRQSLENEIKKPVWQELKHVKEPSFAKQHEVMKFQLQKQISSNLKEIQSLIEKNQQLHRQSTQQIKFIGQLQNKCTKLQHMRVQQSKKVLDLSLKNVKLEQQILSTKLSSKNQSESKSSHSTNKNKTQTNHQQSSSKSNMMEKLQAAYKNLDTSLSNNHQLQKKLKHTQNLLQQANQNLTRIRLQLLNRVLAKSYIDTK